VAGERGACISRACADDGIVDCLELGFATCIVDHVAVCGTDTDGCQHYMSDQNCATSGGTCETDPTTGEGFCQGP
jgi:hypothetical protein